MFRYKSLSYIMFGYRLNLSSVCVIFLVFGVVVDVAQKYGRDVDATRFAQTQQFGCNVLHIALMPC